MNKNHLHPWRKLTDVPLTVDDWHAVYLAQQAFIYQIRRIVEARAALDAAQKAHEPA